MKRLFTFLLISLLVGCTITKRQFNSGYHVEWKKFHSKENNEPNGLNLVDSRENHAKEAEIQVGPALPPTYSFDLSTQKNQPFQDELVTQETLVEESGASEPVEITPQKIQKKLLQEKEEPVDEVEQKTEPLTWVSLALFLGIGLAAGLIAIYSSFLYLGSSIFLTGLVVVFFICALISFIRVHRHREKYKNKWLTVLMFFFAACSLFVAAIYLIYVSAITSMTPMLQGI